jgi:hypothetical protein
MKPESQVNRLKAKRSPFFLKNSLYSHHNLLEKYDIELSQLNKSNINWNI